MVVVMMNDERCPNEGPVADGKLWHKNHSDQLLSKCDEATETRMNKNDGMTRLINPV